MSKSMRESVLAIAALIAALIACSSGRRPSRMRSTKRPTSRSTSPSNKPAHVNVHIHCETGSPYYQAFCGGSARSTRLSACKPGSPQAKAVALARRQRNPRDETPQTWCCNCLPPKRCVQGGGAPWTCYNPTRFSGPAKKIGSRQGKATKNTSARFRITKGTFHPNANLNQACANEFGLGFVLADWNQLPRTRSAILGLANQLRLGGKRNNLSVTRGGKRLYQSGRYYFISRFDHRKPRSYLSHGNIDNHFIDLGSWSGNRRALCFGRPQTTVRQPKRSRSKKTFCHRLCREWGRCKYIAHGSQGGPMCIGRSNRDCARSTQCRTTGRGCWLNGSWCSDKRQVNRRQADACVRRCIQGVSGSEHGPMGPTGSKLGSDCAKQCGVDPTPYQ